MLNRKVSSCDVNVPVTLSICFVLVVVEKLRTAQEVNIQILKRVRIEKVYSPHVPRLSQGLPLPTRGWSFDLAFSTF